MAGTYSDTSNIRDGRMIEAIDVKTPIDDIDTALAGVAGNLVAVQNDVTESGLDVQNVQNNILSSQVDISALQGSMQSMQSQIDLISPATLDELVSGKTAFKKLNFNTSEIVTISAGTITATHSFMTIDTESNVASDDLETITGTDGDYLMLQIADNSRVVVVKHGAGNIITPTGRDVRLRTTDCVLTLQRIGLMWLVASMPPATEGATIYRTTTQVIPNGSNTVVSFNNVIDDGDNMFNVSNPTRLTFRTSGLYIIGSRIQYLENATGFRDLRISRNGDINDALLLIRVSNNNFRVIEGIIRQRFVSGDYIECIASQNSGGNLNLLSNAYSPVFWARRVG